MRYVTILSLLALTSCVFRFGQHVRDYDPATRASGTGATINTATLQVAGELLEVSDTALVVLTSSRVTLVPTRLISAMRFDDLPISQPSSLTPEEARRLRLLSRFPYGMPDEALRRLMTSRQQPTLHIVDK
jgi:hypothetical protein